MRHFVHLYTTECAKEAHPLRNDQSIPTNQHPRITLPFLRSDKAHGLAREVCTKQTRALHVQLQLTAHCAAGHFACGRGNRGGFSFLFCSVMQGLNVTMDSVSVSMAAMLLVSMTTTLTVYMTTY